MERRRAINYLKRKGKVKGKTTYNKKEEELIKEVMRDGKVYGDPTAEISW